MNCTIGSPRTRASISDSSARGIAEQEIRPATRPEALVDQSVDDADDGGPDGSEPQDVRDRDVPPAAAGDCDGEAGDAGHRDDHEALRLEEAPLARNERQHAAVGAREPRCPTKLPPALAFRGGAASLRRDVHAGHLAPVPRVIGVPTAGRHENADPSVLTQHPCSQADAVASNRACPVTSLARRRGAEQPPVRPLGRLSGSHAQLVAQAQAQRLVDEECLGGVSLPREHRHQHSTTGWAGSMSWSSPRPERTSFGSRPGASTGLLRRHPPDQAGAHRTRHPQAHALRPSESARPDQRRADRELDRDRLLNEAVGGGVPGARVRWQRSNGEKGAS